VALSFGTRFCRCLTVFAFIIGRAFSRFVPLRPAPSAGPGFAALLAPVAVAMARRPHEQQANQQLYTGGTCGSHHRDALRTASRPPGVGPIDAARSGFPKTRGFTAGIAHELQEPPSASSRRALAPDADHRWATEPKPAARCWDLQGPAGPGRGGWRSSIRRKFREHGQRASIH
jgi:hypothetical protein